MTKEETKDTLRTLKEQMERGISFRCTVETKNFSYYSYKITDIIYSVKDSTFFICLDEYTYQKTLMGYKVPLERFLSDYVPSTTTYEEEKHKVKHN